MNLPKIKILLLITVCFSCNKTINNNENPNIVLIMADDLGWTDLSFMGSNYYQTPNIDRLAKGGIAFYNAYASELTCIKFLFLGIKLFKIFLSSRITFCE